ncbi:hypothetical protein HW561_17180 [Rhodobacteraceae bacterium B1Z28]|uniref:Uncharacterized protein n=1 Tax=Ruegeria haliotis TaxID=2747601 RepID=A0ABX2PTM9_9RHOB|nr:hypothetical protein [Ruegeria haliotis]NVO57533.1 hypothetical protein [Ruegeria haliotis]
MRLSNYEEDFLCALMAVSACTTKPLETAIPTQAGHNLHSAKVAVDSCSVEADEGGNAAVIGGYATNVLLFGTLIGPILTAPVQDELRTQGEIDQVDRCLTERGFERHELTQGESFWLRNAYGEERVRRLDHLIGGGTIETYGTPKV